jgi:hypothetical protein
MTRSRESSSWASCRILLSAATSRRGGREWSRLPPLHLFTVLTDPLYINTATSLVSKPLSSNKQTLLSLRSIS